MYMSSSVGVTDEYALKQILTRSRAKNEEHHITGMLVLSGDKWMQVLEGTREQVAAMFQTIKQDPRHSNVCKLADGPITQRAFADWSMGFTPASPGEFERIVGYFNPSQTGLPAPYLSQPANEVFELLKEFSAGQKDLF
ncbi:BLUF domain-containing protein [Hymenobacter telluris]|nr:BLUF domain-containing protein [Hymenobacter telluris]